MPIPWGGKEWKNKDLYDPFDFGNSISSKMIHSSWFSLNLIQIKGDLALEVETKHN